MPTPADTFTALRRELERVGARTRNTLRHVSGVAAAEVGRTPRQLVWSHRKVALYRYAPVRPRARRIPILLVMSLITRPYAFDLRPGNSLVARLLEDGYDVYLIDWGVPGPVEGGHTFESYCDGYLPEAIRAVLAHAGSGEVTLFGYCLGAVLCLLTVAGHPELPIRNLALMATPIDFTEIDVITNLLGGGRLGPDDLVDQTGNVPPATMHNAFRLITPTGDVATYLSLWNSLPDDEALAAHQAFVGWSNDHIPFPGGVLRQIVDLILGQRALIDGNVRLGGRVVDLAAIGVPVLDITGERDHLVPAAASEPLGAVLSGAPLDRLCFPSGHAGLFLGRTAQRRYVPAILDRLGRHNPRTDS
jgi:polyhydroxyalkanoate synthase